MTYKPFLLALSLFASADSHANLELTLKTHRTMKPPKGVIKLTEEPREVRQTVRVTLGTDYVMADDGETTVIHDFAKRRVFTIDQKKKRLDDVSLFATVGGRVVELDNRIFLGQVAANSKVGQEHFALPLAEHELSLHRSDMPASKLDAKTTGGEYRHSWNHKELMAWSVETHAVTPLERDAFVRFVRHRFGGHPEVLATLQRIDGIPKRLRISKPAWGETTRIDVSEVRNTPDAPYPPIEAKEVIDDAEMAAVVAVVHAATPESRKETRDAIVAEAVRAAEANQLLAAYLGFLEVSLMTDEPPPVEFIAYRDRFETDADTRAFLDIEPKSEEEAKAAVATLGRLQLVAQRKAYVAGIMRANHQQNLGDHEAAFRNYRSALKANPLLTGVWKDYGQLLLHRYQADEAWHCWDTARKIAPQHPLMNDIDELEARLLQQNPGYF